MAKKVWVLRLADGTHTVELKDRFWSDKREIFVDGVLIKSFTKSSDTDLHHFWVSGHPCVLQRKFQYELYVNRKPVLDEGALLEWTVDEDALRHSIRDSMYGPYIRKLKSLKSKKRKTT